MGKLTKAERDTLIKRIQEAKKGSTFAVIAAGAAALTAFYFWVSPSGLNDKGKILLFIIIVLMVILIITAFVQDGTAKELQNKLDKDSE